VHYCVAACFLLYSILSWGQNLANKLDVLIDQQLPTATVGVLIKNLQTNEIIYSRNAEKLLTPASSVKLFTAAAAMYALPEDFRFITPLSRKDRHYYLTFSGSPSLTAKNLGELIANLPKHGIKKIDGDLILDSSHYPAPFYLNGNSYDDLGWGYTAPDSAVIINENKETYSLKSGKLGELVQIIPKSSQEKVKQKQFDALTLINEVKTVTKDEEQNRCSLHLDMQESNTITLSGCVAQSKNLRNIELAIPDPEFYAQQILKEALKNNEIALKGTIKKGKTPKDVQYITSLQSAVLNKMIKHMLQQSDNLYANTLVRTLGCHIAHDCSYKQGMYVLKKIIQEQTQLDPKKMELVDGEGTRYNLISPSQLVTLLTQVYQDLKLRPRLMNSLPQSGISGTLQGRFKNTVLEKKVFAKTGTMHDVSSLSGFIINPGSTSVVFSIITNGVIKSEKAKALEEKILLTVIEDYIEKTHKLSTS